MFNRHDRVWLSAAGWHAMRAQFPAHAEAFAQWEENVWPLIVRRNEADAEPDCVCLGLPLPPDASGNKLRIAVVARTENVAHRDAPLAVDLLTANLPSAWQKIFGDFADTAARDQMHFHVYGSAAMQSMTALPYLHASSDIDLLFYPHTRAELDRGVRLLQQHARQLPLDGEIAFPSGRAVAWKEWLGADDAQGPLHILTKSMQSVNLVRREDLLAELD